MTSPDKQPLPEEIKGPLISTGMGRSLHAWLSAALMVVAIFSGLAAQAFTAQVIALIFLAAAVGLLGEVFHLLRTGKITARHGTKSNRFLIIRRKESPGHFYFHVVAYITLGAISLLIGCGITVLLLMRHPF